MKTLTEKEFNEAISRDVATLVCFGASWCGKCTLAKSKFNKNKKAPDIAGA